MGKVEKLRSKIEEVEELKPVIYVSSGDEDDDEANEDLSLKIVEKALLMRAVKLAEIDIDGVVLVDDNVFKNDSGVVGLCGDGSGGNGGGRVVENALSLSLDAGAVVNDPCTAKKRKKKKKTQKMESENQSDDVWKEEDEAGTEEKVENDMGVQTTVELDNILDTNSVQISDNMVLRKLLRGPRYFDSPDSGWSTCYNCGKEGHMALNCPSLEKKKRPCFLCGSLEHGFKQCSKERACIICKSVGHRAKNCPEKQKSSLQSSKVCLKCGDYGHVMFSCKNSYALDDLKEIQCYICKSFGHLCCVNVVDNSPREFSCYKCGELGHNGPECLSIREDATTTASPITCYKCGERGHFARECTSSVKVGKSKNEHSTPLRSHKENKEARGFKCASQEFGKSRKRWKTKSGEHSLATLKKPKQRGGWIMEDTGERSLATPKSPKQRGGWITEDHGDMSQSRHRKTRWSSSTPLYKGHVNSTFVSGGQTSGSQSSKKMQAPNWGTSAFQGSATPFQHRYSASRFSNSGNAGYRGNYNWW